MQIASPSDPSGFETLEAFSRATALNRWLYKKINRFLKGDVLEIGSGIGNISSLLLRDQHNIFLSDLRPEYCDLLKNKFGGDSHLKGVFEIDLSLPYFELRYQHLHGQFDSVVALNVIEHIANDSLAIQNAKSLLRQNGKLIVLVPSGQWLYNSLDKELGHYRRYNRTKLNDLLKSSGLMITSSFYFNSPAILGWWLSGSILKNNTISASKLNIYDKLVPIFKIGDWFTNPFTGISVISVGTKILN